ncbi:4-hydroxy-tetrahydrodipicolinate reductase, partial [Candidatus Woesearchaeota archaeon]|nr:4-hydroxy-tetrahydrodipicolinate reductase [Candidatus Woesearchaeota archaeon]
MKAAIIGYGKMGHEIEDVLKEKGIEVAAIIDPVCEAATAKEISAETLRDADVCIDFTHPDCALKNVEAIAKIGKNIVLGTTGWYDDMTKMRKIVEDNSIGMIWASNFSIGVNVFFSIVEQAARIFDRIPEYDVFSYELHHNQKADSPSGTAKTIGKILLENISSKTELQTGRLDRPPRSEELHLASVRAGNIPGTHVVGFDSQADTIQLKHQARSRKGFALGAV